jgi:hypothetical protein
MCHKNLEKYFAYFKFMYHFKNEKYILPQITISMPSRSLSSNV